MSLRGVLVPHGTFKSNHQYTVLTPGYPVMRSQCPVPQEYETQSSEEARFVKQLDQCEMILQASEYEDMESQPGRLQDFFDSTAGTQAHKRF